MGTPFFLFFLLMPGESAVLPMSHQAFSLGSSPLGSIALLKGSGTSVEDCDPTMPDPQCSARHREILHRFVHLGAGSTIITLLYEKINPKN